MKKILTLLSFLITLQLSAQTTYWQSINNYEKIRGVWGDSVLRVATDTVKNKAAGSLAYVNSQIYFYNTKWRPVASGSSGSGISAVFAGSCLIQVNDSTLALDPACAGITDLYRRSDSVFYVKNSIETFAYTDSTGGGGGSGNTNSNIGSGYRWAVPGTNDIKTFSVGAGLLLDSTTNADELLLTIDTNNIAFDGDTTIVNNFITNKSLLIPRTDTVNAKQRNGSIIFDTIYRHYMGYIDGTWLCLDCSGGGGGSVAWGDITGTLSDQTDLQSALDTKLESAGDLSPIFTTSEPSQNISFSLSNAGPYEYLGNNTGSSAAPTYNVPTFARLGDVALSSLNDNDLLKYNAGTGKWNNFAPSYITLSDLSATAPITYSSGVISTSMSTGKLIGRYSAGTGVMQEITVGTNLSLSGGGTLSSDDLDAYHTVTEFADSTGFTINRPNGTKDSIAFAAGATYTASNGITLSGTDFRWGGTLTGNTTITGAGFRSAFSGGRLEAGKGADVAAANDLTLGGDGNMFTITGATQINAITTANWQAGSEVSLVFASTPTVKHNTTGGAGTAKILLAGGIDFTATANDLLVLKYDGTVWHESSRKLSSTGTAAQLTAQQIGFGSSANFLTGLDSLKYDATNRLITSTNSQGGATFTVRSSTTLANTNALLLQNTTDATSSITGLSSPLLVFGAKAWKSAITAGSWQTYWGIGSVGITGVGALASALQFYNISGNGVSPSGMTWAMSLSDVGGLTTNGGITAGNTGASSVAAATIQGPTSANLVIASGNATSRDIVFKLGGSIVVGQFMTSTGNFLVQGESGSTSPTDPENAFSVYRNTTSSEGTVTNIAGGTTVTGTGTHFLNTFKIGDQITISGESQIITAIASNTSMTTNTWTNAHTGATYTAQSTINIFNVKLNGLIGVGTTSPKAFLDLPASTANYSALAITTGTAPSASVTDKILLYAEDVSSSAELKVRDEAGNITTLSPHNFSGIPGGRSNPLAWSYYSEKDGKYINVDMYKLAELVEKITGEKLIYTGNVNDKPNLINN